MCLSEVDSVAILFSTRDEDLVPVRSQMEERRDIRRISTLAPQHDNSWPKIGFSSGRLGSFGADLIERGGFRVAFVSYSQPEEDHLIEVTFSRNGERKHGYRFCDLSHLFEAIAEEVEVSMWSRCLSVVLTGLAKPNPLKAATAPALCFDREGNLYKREHALA